MRTITQILIDADKAKTKDELIAFSDEIGMNRTKYLLIELEFAAEHLQELHDKINKIRKYS